MKLVVGTVSVQNFPDPTWRKTAPRKWIQFTRKRNGSNHKFHLDTETRWLLISQLVSSKYSYYKANFFKESICQRSSGYSLICFCGSLWTFCDCGVTITMYTQLLLRSIMPICSVDRVRTVQCSMHLTAARFRHQLHLKYWATPQLRVHKIFCPPRKMCWT